MVQADKLVTAEKAIKKEAKDMAEALHLKTKETIEGLSDEQVLDLLRLKWIAPLCASLRTMPDSIIAGLEKAVQTLADKYAVTYMELDRQIRQSKALLADMIDNLSGDEFDARGLEQFRALLIEEKEFYALQTLKDAILENIFPQVDEDAPKVRFKEFDDNWSKVELGEIADKVTEKNIQNFITETFTNSAEHGIISQREFFDHDISKADKINGYYIVENDDFVYNPRISVTAPCGPINCNRLGRRGVMSPLYTVFRTHDIDTLFLEWYFKSPHWYAYMRFNGDSGARSDRFSIKTDLFFKMPIPMPSMEEQHKIGQVLQNLDDIIKLYQQELEKLQSIKKALLGKMFV